MIQKIRLFLYLSLFAFAFASCEKEYSYEGGDIIPPGGGGTSGTAIYTLKNAADECTAAVISGSFTAGTAATSANTAEITVTVDSIGTYIVSAGPVNGITYSGSGTFTETGEQTILLTASGTPTAAGNFSFNPGGSGCTYSITVAPASGGGGTAAYTFKNATGGCTDAIVSGTYTAGTALTAFNKAEITVTANTEGTYNIVVGPVNGITFSANGTFATTGEKKVELTGSGTPAAAGDFSFAPGGAAGCSFTVTVAPGATNSTDFIHCKIDGVDKAFDVAAIGLEFLGPITISGSDGTTESAGNFSITLANLVTFQVAAGTYNILSATNFENTCTIAYIPTGTSEDAWASATAGQSGTFTVIVTSVTTDRISGTFSGTLYDNEGNGTNTKAVTNGTFSVPK
ncbi:MAG: hypothetical protein QM791_17475 [Ferruginibacter sp.]